MTDSEKLDLILSEMQGMKTDMQSMKTDIHHRQRCGACCIKSGW